MEQSKFLALKDLFEQYMAYEDALEKLARSQRILDSQRMSDAGFFTIELGVFRSQVGGTATRTEALKPVVQSMIDQLTTYYQARLEELNRAIEAA